MPYFTRHLRHGHDVEIFYIFILKNGFYCVTFQKWVAKLSRFAIINAWQHFGNISGTNFNRKIASEFEGLFSHLSPEMPLFQALSGIFLV